MILFVSWDGDRIGRLAGKARLTDDVEEVRKISQRIDLGNEIWKSFALSCGGTMVECGGDEGAISIDASHLHKVPDIARQYAEKVGATVSVGIGKLLSESSKALLVCKLRGGDKVLLWDPGMQDEIDKAGQKDEKDKLAEEYLNKSDGGAAGPAPKKHGGAHGQDHEEGAEAAKVAAQAPEVEQTNAEEGLEDMLHSAAQDQEQKDTSDATDQDKHLDDVKNQLVQILAQVKEKAPIIQQLQQVDPDAFTSVMNLVQGVIALGKEVMGGTDAPTPPGQPVKKSELEKAIVDIKPGKRVGLGLVPPKNEFSPERLRTTHDYSHLLSPEHQKAGLKLVVHHDKKYVPQTGGSKKFLGEDITAELHKDRIPGGTPGPAYKLGYVIGKVHRPGSTKNGATVKEPSIEPHSHLEEGWRGKGLGLAMYEAAFAHAKNVEGITHVHGGIHSVDADALHKRLSKKHGFDYRSYLEGDPAEDDYPYSDYRYALKSEQDGLPEHAYIGPGKGVVFGASGETPKSPDFKPENEFDQSKATDPNYLKGYVKPEWHDRIGMFGAKPEDLEYHYEPHFDLSQVHGNPGYKNYLDTSRYEHWKTSGSPEEYDQWRSKNDPFSHFHDYLKSPQRQPIVLFQHDNKVQPADGSHRLGFAEEQGVSHLPAIIARPKMKKYEDHIPGGAADDKKPSDFDHEAVEHGADEEGKEHANNRDIAREIAMDHLSSDPHYYDKGEEVDPEEDHAEDLEKVATREHLQLPVGSQVGNHIKIQHGDGKTGWRQVGAGMIQSSKDADAPIMGANSHPVSSREPNSK